MPSIIIPAHNEKIVIRDCLLQFYNHLEQENFEVIVICNGCVDNTAHVVSQISKKIVCIETSEASKTKALNIGDQIANYFPRIYLDADVILPFETIKALCDSLNRDNLIAVSPEVKMIFYGASWFVKAYYDIWLSLPYCKKGMIGAGVYALSEEGRNRFLNFPEIIADDGYVRCQFCEHERGIVRGFYSFVKAPRNIYALIKIKTRSRLGRYELEERFPNLICNEQKNYRDVLKILLQKINLWPKVIVYLMMNYVTRVRAKWQYNNRMITWERDETSRQR